MKCRPSPKWWPRRSAFKRHERASLERRAMNTHSTQTFNIHLSSSSLCDLYAMLLTWPHAIHLFLFRHYKPIILTRSRTLYLASIDYGSDTNSTHPPLHTIVNLVP